MGCVAEFLSTPSARRATLHTHVRSEIPRGFLSTPSARRATRLAVFVQRRLKISIHALREEGDPRPRLATALFWNFYPRPPRGGRPRRLCGLGWRGSISIHALREEGDFKPLRRCARAADDFYPRPPRGGRPMEKKCLLQVDGISIHALREEGDPRH